MDGFICHVFVLFAQAMTHLTILSLLIANTAYFVLGMVLFHYIEGSAQDGQSYTTSEFLDTRLRKCKHQLGDLVLACSIMLPILHHNNV